MPVTPETLPRHELVGLDVEVVAGSNPDVIGLAGTVVTETTRTLGIEGSDRVWHVPKDGTAFAFDLATSRGIDSEECVRVDGERLVNRPARRTEDNGDSQWR